MPSICREVVEPSPRKPQPLAPVDHTVPSRFSTKVCIAPVAMLGLETFPMTEKAADATLLVVKSVRKAAAFSV